MKTKISPATVGMFVLGALTIFIVGFLSFGGSNIFSRPARFLIYFEESVSGLDPGAPLKFTGVRIGRVAAVNVRYDAATKKALVQTICEINRNVLTDSAGVIIDLTNPAELQGLIDRGLRAPPRSARTHAAATGMRVHARRGHEARPGRARLRYGGKGVSPASCGRSGVWFATGGSVSIAGPPRCIGAVRFNLHPPTGIKSPGPSLIDPRTAP